MTIDVWLRRADEAFLDEIDEIIEDTMVQIFILHPKDEDELEEAKAQAQEHNPIFYCAPAALYGKIDAKCVAFSVHNIEELQTIQKLGKPLFLNASDLDEKMRLALTQNGHRGVILNALQSYEELEKFYISIGPDNIEAFDKPMLEKLPMQRIVMHSGYPGYGFEAIFETSKKISDVIFRPDPSIIAAATKNTLSLFEFKMS